MNITFKNTNFVDFSTINRGDTFIDPDYDEGTILMRVAVSCCDVILNTDTDITDNYDGYAVDIQTGGIIGYYNSVEVIPVKADVIVTY